MNKFFTKRNIIITIAVVVVLAIAAIAFILFSKDNEKVNYTIAFNSQGGSAVEFITANEGEMVKLPDNPTKEGYNFSYWADEEQKPVSNDLKVERNISLTAVWVEKDKELYKVTFDTKGGSKISPISVAKGEELTLPNNPTRDGYEFKEWKDSNNNVIKNKFAVEKDITLVAVWAKKEEEKPKEQPKKETKNEQAAKPVNATEIVLNTSDFSMVVNTKKTLKATVKPSNASDKRVEWSSNNTSVATVDNNGVVKAVGLGTAIIKAKTSNGKQAMISVTSTIKSVTLSASRSTISYKGVKEAKVTATIDANGYNFPNSEITWSIPDASGQNAAASSSTNGKTAVITARSNGLSGNIPVTIKVGGKQAKTTIKVEPSMYLYASSSNTTTFTTVDDSKYSATFSSASILAVSSNVDVTWSYPTTRIISKVSAKSSRELKVNLAKVPGTFTINVESAGGQTKQISVVSRVRLIKVS